MEYTVFNFQVTAANQELLLGLLSSLDFESFEELDQSIKAFVLSRAINEDFLTAIEGFKEFIPFTYEYNGVETQNWNAIWEENFQPILVDDFCGIRADFHPPVKGVKYELVINPKMAFGTGHHETTYMMIQEMRQLRFPNTKVLDYGCGTGVLAILAAKMGAQIIDAVDNDKNAYLNTMENIQHNNVDNVQVLHGTLGAVVDTNYKIILANINKNVLLQTLSALYKKLSKGGSLLLSGILAQDAKQMRLEAEQQGFTINNQLQRGEWVCMHLLQ